MADFSVVRAEEWLRSKFGSFDTSVKIDIPANETKNEKEFFESSKVLGFVKALKLGDVNKPLLVMAVKMRKNLTERTSRQVQFAFAKKALQQAIKTASQYLQGLPTQGLFFFYDSDQYFRLSLVSGEMEGRSFKYSEAKRQSFYIDPDKPNNVAKSRLCVAINTFSDLKEAFSVEKLTKEFYSRLFSWYEWAMDSKTNVHFPNDIDDKEDDRKYNNEAIIRLITRLMFIWFIKQRGIVPEDLFDADKVKKILKTFSPESMDEDNYYQCILQNLFFATLNCHPSERKFIDRPYKGVSNGFFVKTQYRHKAEIVDPEYFQKDLMGRIPFLNCALFDCLDKRVDDKNGGKPKYLLFDGFSERPVRQAHVPNGLFFHKEKGLIKLFDTYEFTIDENNPNDADIALDPELLGKVFENLLGAFNPETQETARKATGSFYTPREIVDYMVNESLKNLLKSKVPELTDEMLDNLFDDANRGERRLPFGEDAASKVRAALYDCKILDPACGSGAFPMGMLQAMVRLFERLDPNNTELNSRLIARFKSDKANVPVDLQSDKEREEWVKELERRLRKEQLDPDYARKLYLIENCIYGVDIQPIATQISKLRFFISLLCDQLRTGWNGKDAEGEFLALPNLEAKFVCANTLIGLPETEDELDFNDELKKLRIKLQKNRHYIFRARTYRQKKKRMGQDEAIREEIKTAVNDSLAKPDAQLIATQQEVIRQLRREREKVAMPKWVKHRKMVQGDLFGGFEQSEIEFEEIDENKKKRDTIDKQIDSAECTIAKERNKASIDNMQVAEKLASLVAGWDPYDQNAVSPFFDPKWMFNIEDGFDIVIGNPPYVVTHDELYRNYETYKCFELYAYFFEVGINLLKENGVLTFITASLYVKGVKFATLRELLERNVELIHYKKHDDNAFDNVVMPTATFICRKCFGDWKFQELDPLMRIAKKLESGAKPLARISDIMRGLELGRDAMTMKGDIPCITGSTVNKWMPTDIQFISRNLLRCYSKEERFFAAERVLLRETGSILTAVYVNGKLYSNRSLYSILPTDKQCNVKFLTACLNAATAQFYYQAMFKTDTDFFPKIRIAQARQIPIPDVKQEQQKPIVDLVDQILAAKKQNPNADTSALEAKIDQLVYKLYGLTEEEIAVVENRGKEEATQKVEKSRRIAKPKATQVIKPEEDEELE